MEIANNGYGDQNMVWGQENRQNLGAVTSGTIYGTSSWTPSVSWDTSSYYTATRFYIQLTVTRGTGTYTPNWHLYY